MAHSHQEAPALAFLEFCKVNFKNNIQFLVVLEPCLFLLLVNAYALLEGKFLAAPKMS
jgi:hypothetical protein